MITFIPGGERVSPELLTVPLWFERFQANPLLELRNLGLVNIFLDHFWAVALFCPVCRASQGQPRLGRVGASHFCHWRGGFLCHQPLFFHAGTQ